MMAREPGRESTAVVQTRLGGAGGGRSKVGWEQKPCLREISQ